MSNVVPEGWVSTAIGEAISEIADGGTPATSNPEYFGGSIPWIVINDIQPRITHTKSSITDLGLQKSSAKLWDKGTIILSTGATIGEVGIAMKTMATKQGICGVVVKSDVSAKYFYHLLVSKKRQLNILSQGSTIKETRPPTIKKIQICLPPLPEQKKIASILTSVDEVIENTQKQIDKLQDLKKATMSELLTIGIDHTEFKDSELGRIPKSWEVVNLRERFTFGGGSTPSRTNTDYFCDKGKGFVWVKTTDLNDSDIFDSEENITKEGLSASSCKIHPAGTVVVAMYGGWNQIGRTGLLRNDASINQALTAILPLASVIPSFLNYWLVTMRYKWKQIAASSRKDPNITKADVEGFKIAIPSIEEQKEITKIADSISHQISMAGIKLTQTQSLKKSLMQDLLTGKVRVSIH